MDGQSREPAMIGEILGHYRIESKLGEDGMGEVWKARENAHLTRMRIAVSCLLILMVALGSAAQQTASGDVDTMLRQARDEIRNFEKARGKRDDPSHPIEKWVNALWALREKSPRNACP